jgi:hypothetical protein
LIQPLASTLVAQWWPGIERVAAMLLLKGRLNRDELRELVFEEDKC